MFGLFAACKVTDLYDHLLMEQKIYGSKCFKQSSCYTRIYKNNNRTESAFIHTYLAYLHLEGQISNYTTYILKF